MTFDEWLAGVPPELAQDPLWRMEVYRLAVFVGDLAWQDVSRLIKEKLGCTARITRRIDWR